MKSFNVEWVLYDSVPYVHENICSKLEIIVYIRILRTHNQNRRIKISRIENAIIFPISSHDISVLCCTLKQYLLLTMFMASLQEWPSFWLHHHSKIEVYKKDTWEGSQRTTVPCTPMWRKDIFTGVTIW